MIDTISEYQFTDWFMKHRPNNFSYEGTKALFDYLTELEEDCGQPMEFDPIAFCCEYDEYDSIEECLKQYDDIDTIEELRDNTTVIDIEGSQAIIIQTF